MNARDLADLAREMQARVLSWTGIPVKVGIAETKVLAKLASEAARTSGGTRALLPGPATDAVLDAMPVEAVWGVGPKWAALLRSHGVATAGALRDVPLSWARRHLTVVGERLVLELRGVPCLALGVAPASQAEHLPQPLVRRSPSRTSCHASGGGDVRGAGGGEGAGARGWPRARSRCSSRRSTTGPGRTAARASRPPCRGARRTRRA